MVGRSKARSRPQRSWHQSCSNCRRAAAITFNLVPPAHVVPQILEGMLVAIEGGLRLPLVYKTSAYDSLDSLELMSGLVVTRRRPSIPFAGGDR